MYLAIQVADELVRQFSKTTNAWISRKKMINWMWRLIVEKPMIQCPPVAQYANNGCSILEIWNEIIHTELFIIKIIYHNFNYRNQILDITFTNNRCFAIRVAIDGDICFVEHTPITAIFMSLYL